MKRPCVVWMSCDHRADYPANQAIKLSKFHSDEKIFTQLTCSYVWFHVFRRFGHHGPANDGTCEGVAMPIQIGGRPSRINVNIQKNTRMRVTD